MVNSGAYRCLLAFLAAAFSVLCFAAPANAATDTCTLRAIYEGEDGGLQVVVNGNSLDFSGGTLTTQFFNISKEAGYSLPLKAQEVTKVGTDMFCFAQGDYYLVIASESSRQKLSIVEPFAQKAGVDCKKKSAELIAKEKFAFRGNLVAGTEEFCALSIVAVLVAATGSFCSTLGMNLQKLTHDRLEKEGNHNANPFKQPVWLMGLFFIVFDAAVLDVVTFGMASASLLAPLASLVLVWNIFLAPLMLGEALDKPGLAATAVIISGTVMASAAAPHVSPVFSPDFLAARFGSPEVVVYLATVATILASMWYRIDLIRRTNTTTRECVENLLDANAGEKLNNALDSVTEDSASTDGVKLRIDRQGSRNSWGTIDDAGKGSSDDDTKALGDFTEKEAESFEKLELSNNSFDYKFMRFGCGFLAGLLGGQSVLFAKLVIELLKTSIFGASQNIEYMCFADFKFYIYLAVLVFVLVTQMNILNVGLKHFDSLVIIPLMITFYNVFGIVGGGIYYQEFNNFTPWQIVLFPCGVLISFSGIYLLATTSGKVKSPGAGEEDGLDARRSVFRLSVSIPLIAPDETSSPAVRLSRRSVSSNVRRSMTVDDTRRQMSGHRDTGDVELSKTVSAP
jgi:hypothetical protein